MTWGGHQKEHSTPVNHILLYVFVIFFPLKTHKKIMRFPLKAISLSPLSNWNYSLSLSAVTKL